jgi:cephalosporin hydroxylase
MDSVVRDFHKKYYDESDKTWTNTKWMGIRVAKCPLDLWIYQEIIYETMPNVIIETGTWQGGSAYYFAHLMEIIGIGRKVITIDISSQAKVILDVVNNPRIMTLTGSSTDETIVKTVKSFLCPGDKVMVILDSDHSKAHVLEELEVYAPLVTPGCYLIVEDTNVNGHPVFEDHGPGPMEAIDDWLRIPGTDRMFEMDRSREKFMMTFNPRGYFKRRGA